MSDLITLEIDGKEVQAAPGTMLIEAAGSAGINIPRFCYHKKLSVAANCRMCMVEVEKAPKPLPACATPVGEGMKVSTASELAIDAQKGTMEFLLINHPLDCPICDQGGECELQDVALTYGSDISRFTEAKRIVPDPNLGSLISTDMNRCIHCTRCVRFGEEIAGMRELGATGRGEFVKIGTFIEKSVESELSGNVVDVCPVGALTAKPSRFKFRPWELVAKNGIAPHDGIGSNLVYHLNKGKITRVVPDDNDTINECWISDRDRFSYEGLYTNDRATSPMLKVQGEWQPVSWDVALEEVAKRLKTIDAAETAAMISPNSTLEEMYLAQKLLRGIGVNSIDHRASMNDFRDQDAAPLYPSLGVSIENLENQNAVLLVGSNVRKEQPIVGLRLRKASLNGAALMSINPRDYEFYFDQQVAVIADPHAMIDSLAQVVNAVLKEKSAKAPASVKALLKDVKPDDAAKEIAKTLIEAEEALLLLGVLAINHPDAALFNALAEVLAENAGANVGYLAEGSNAAGAWLTGILPHRGIGGEKLDATGLDSRSILEQPPKNLILMGLELERDSSNPIKAAAVLSGADFVLSLDSYSNELTREVADVILPIAAAMETPGSMINLEGRLQTFVAATKPPGDAKHAWAVLRMLGSMMELDGFDYANADQVLAAAVNDMGQDDGSTSQFSSSDALERQHSNTGALQRYTEAGIYGSDPIVRRAKSLQKTSDAADEIILSPEDANAQGVGDGDTVKVMQEGAGVEMKLKVDASLPAGFICIQSGYGSHAQLGSAFGSVELVRV